MDDSKDAETTTYSQIRDDPFFDRAEKDDRLIDETLGTMVVLLKRGGNDTAVEAMAAIAKTSIEQDQESCTMDLWLEHEPEDTELINDNVDDLRAAFHEVVARKSFPLDWMGTRVTIPSVPYGWRTMLSHSARQKRPTNHARKVRQASIFKEDWLSFTNNGELTVYRALKQIQEQDLPPDDTIGIFPLAGGRLLGKTWEPDVLVTYKGRAGILEIDGPDHNRRRALDTTRDHLFRDSGAAYVDRVPVEALNNTMEMMGSLRRFLRRLGETK